MAKAALALGAAGTANADFSFTINAKIGCHAWGLSSPSQDTCWRDIRAVQAIDPGFDYTICTKLHAKGRSIGSPVFIGRMFWLH